MRKFDLTTEYHSSTIFISITEQQETARYSIGRITLNRTDADLVPRIVEMIDGWNLKYGQTSAASKPEE